MAEKNKPEVKLSASDTLKVNLFYWLQALVTALLILILVFTFVGRVIVVRGDSMNNTLYDGDLMLVYELGYTPKQGDVVVVNKLDATFLSNGSSEAIVKRVIAVGGQTVKVDYAAGAVYVDGVALDEPYIKEAMVDMSIYYPNICNTELTVPEGTIFVMGDNRNNSTDSRDIRLGVIDEQYVIGRATCVFLPFGDIKSLMKT